MSPVSPSRWTAVTWSSITVTPLGLPPQEGADLRLVEVVGVVERPERNPPAAAEAERALAPLHQVLEQVRLADRAAIGDLVGVEERRARGRRRRPGAGRRSGRRRCSPSRRQSRWRMPYLMVASVSRRNCISSMPRCWSICRNTAVVPSPTPMVPSFELSTTVMAQGRPARRAASPMHQRGQPAGGAAPDDDDPLRPAAHAQPALRVSTAGECRQPVAVRGEQVVGQRPDLVEVELGGGVRVEHRRVVDVLGVLGQQRLHGQVLDVDVGAHQRDQLRRDVPHDRRLQAVGVDQRRHLDGAAVGQLRDVAAVAEVAVDHRRLAGDDRVDDRARVLVARRHLDPVGPPVGLGLLLPAWRSARRSASGTRRAGCRTSRSGRGGRA